MAGGERRHPLMASAQAPIEATSPLQMVAQWQELEEPPLQPQQQESIASGLS